MLFNTKKFIKSKICNWLASRPIKTKKIVVASTGRAGSTMLADAICESILSVKLGRQKSGGLVDKILKSAFFSYVPRLESVKKSNSIVLKTHDIWNDTFSDDALFIFIHGDPLDSVLSVVQMTERYGMDWFNRHQYHLRASGNFQDLYTEDVLNYRGQLQSWLTTKNSNVFVVAYEDLWMKKEDIANFVGFELYLPIQKDRSEKTIPDAVNFKMFDELRELRHRLSER